MNTTKQIPDIVRKGILDKLLVIGHVAGGTSYRDFVHRVYPSANTITLNRTKLIDEVARHCDAFPGDWGDDAGMFNVLNYMEWTDKEILHFCEEYVSPVFTRVYWDEDKGERVDLQPQCVDAINMYLKDCGYVLTAVNKIADKVEYKLVSTSGVQGKIQGIVFTALYKPDVLLKDVLNHEVEIPKDDNRYLYYQEDVGINGITWKALNEWYGKNCTTTGTLSDRLWRAVRNCNTPIEEKFYSVYLEIVEEYGEDIPALLPQVYLYYDSKTQKERVEKIFEHQCMDFLFVFSENQRIVIELDGQQHYACEDHIAGARYTKWIASPLKYAQMVSAQRLMTLAGYEVYRFGGKEFEQDYKKRVKEFIVELFAKYKKI